MSFISYIWYASSITSTTSITAHSMAGSLRFKMSVISYTWVASSITSTTSTMSHSIDRIPWIQDVSYLLHIICFNNYINFFHYGLQHRQDSFDSRCQLSLTHEFHHQLHQLLPLCHAALTGSLSFKMAVISFTQYAICINNYKTNYFDYIGFKMSLFSYTWYASTITITTSTMACNIDRIP